MSLRWIATLLIAFITLNGVVLAGDSATHLAHDGSGVSLHADDHDHSRPFSETADHQNCDGGDHDCHSHASTAPLRPLSPPSLAPPGDNWLTRETLGQVLSGRQPPVPPPNTVTF